MSSDTKIAAYTIDQGSAAGAVAARPMFGEYGLCCDGGKMVAIIGEDQLLVTTTIAGAHTPQMLTRGLPIGSLVAIDSADEMLAPPGPDRRPSGGKNAG